MVHYLIVSNVSLSPAKATYLVIKAKHYECWQQMTGFLQIGKNGSWHVLTLLLSQQADNRFLLYYTHLMSTKCAFRKRKFDWCDCPNFEVMSSPVFVSFIFFIFLGDTLSNIKQEQNNISTEYIELIAEIMKSVIKFRFYCSIL